MVTFETASRELDSSVCRCGRDKAQGDAFCRGCWLQLSPDLRSILVHFCRHTRASRYMGRRRKALIYWRCLVALGLTVKTATAEQFQPKEGDPCSLDFA